MIDLVSSTLIIAVQIAQASENLSEPPECLVIEGIEYCRKQEDTPTIQQNQEIETIQQNQEIETIPETITPVSDAPIYQLNPETMEDPRYAQVYFTFNSVKTQNDCIESLLLVIENLPQRGNTICAETVSNAFGDEFITNPTVRENIFRMTAHYTRSVLKREFKLPLGLERRLTTATGLVIEE